MNAAVQATLPAIGAAFEGGTFAGITLHNDQLAALVLMPGDTSRVTWDRAAEVAKEQGGELPSRHDMLVLLKNVKSEFRTDDWYWTNEEVAGDADCAWVADFYHGGQNWLRKSIGCRCRAVRRVAI